MEREIKKRNSILRSSAAEEKTADSVRIRRRISFNKRKSVREFCASEETKAWNTSYDVSDPKNHSNETVGEKSVNNKYFAGTTNVETTIKYIDHELNEKDTDEIGSTFNNNRTMKIANHRDSIALPLRNSYAVIGENSLEITLTEKERQLRLNKNNFQNNLSLTLFDYEADNFCRTQSLTMEAEKTDYFRHELKEHSDVNDQSSKNPRTENMQLDFSSSNADNKKCPPALPQIDCYMDISVPKLPIAQNKHNSTKNHNVNDAMDIMDLSSCANEIINQRTLHFNEDIGGSTPPSINKVTSSRRTIIFDSEEPDDAMNISHVDGENNADVSMNDVFTVHKETEDMDLTKIPETNHDDKAVEGKDKQKLVFKHVSVANTVLTKESVKENSNILERQLEEQNKDIDFKPTSSKSATFWKLDDNRNDSTLSLANVTSDSDRTFSECILSSAGGKLNYRQLNDELEKGRIKLFSGKPTPVKKSAGTPLSTRLRINLLKTKAELSCIKDVSDNEKNANRSIEMQPRTPLSKGRINQLIQETPHRSLLEFEENELQTRIEQMEIEKSRVQSPCMESRNILPARNETRFFDNISLNSSKLDIENEIKNKPQINNIGMHEHQNLEHKELTVYEPNHKKERRRLTVLAPTDMEVEGTNETGSNTCENVNIEKNLKKRQTLLVPEEMAIDESLLLEEENKNNSTYSNRFKIREKVSENSNNRMKNGEFYKANIIFDENLVENKENNEMQYLSELELKKFNSQSKTNSLTVSAVHKMILEACEPVSIPYQGNKNPRRTVLTSKVMDIEMSENMHNINKNLFKMEDKEEKQEDMKKTINKSNKRHTILTNESMAIEEDKSQAHLRMQNEEKAQLIHQNLRYSNKRQTMLSNEPIEIEEDKSQAYARVENQEKSMLVHKNLRNFNKRQTMLSNESIEVEGDNRENENSKVEENQFIGESIRKSNQRQTILSSEDIEIENDKNQSRTQMQNEQESMVIHPNLRKSNKRQTMLSDESIEIEEDKSQTQLQNEELKDFQFMQKNRRETKKPQTLLSNESVEIEEDATKSYIRMENQEKPMLTNKNLRKPNKRQTIHSNEAIEIEEYKNQTYTPKQNEEKEYGVRVNQSIGDSLRKSHKRQTMLSNEPTEVEENKRENEKSEVEKNQFIGEISRKSNKRQTILSNEPIEVEENKRENKKSEVEENQFIGEISVKSNKRQTMLSNEPIEIENDKNQSRTQMQNEEESMVINPNLRKSNKRQTTFSNEPIDIDNNKNTFVSKLLSSRSSSHLSQEKNETQYDMDETIETEHFKNSTIHHYNFSENKKRFTVLATKEMEMDSSVKTFENVEIKEKIRASKHKRCTLRDDLNISLESASPVSKIRNIEVAAESNKTEEGMELSINKTPNRSKTSHIPVLISSAMKSKKSQSICKHDQTQGEPSGFELGLDTLPLPMRWSHKFEDQNVSLNVQQISMACTQANFPDIVNNLSRFNEDLLYLTRDTCSLIENETLDLQDSNHNDNKNNNGNDNDNNKIVPIVIEDDEITVTNFDDSNIKFMNEKTFDLPKAEPLPDLEIEFAELRRLRAKPKIADVFAHYRRLSAGLPLDLNDVTVPSVDNTRVEESELVTNIRERLSALMSHFDHYEEILENLRIPQEATIDRLCNLIIEKCPNWIINRNMQARKRLILYHKRLSHVSYLLKYKQEHGLCGDIEITLLKRKQVFCKRHWKPIDYVLEFQLQLEEPHNLMHYYKFNDFENICESMCRIDECCSRVKELGVSMWRIVLLQGARLIRIENNTYVEKIVRRFISEPNKEYPRVENIEYLIELQNLREICFKNIFKPRPYAFREEFQVFHKGLEFLQIFLKDPEKYLK